jgi:hypothetical protein
MASPIETKIAPRQDLNPEIFRMPPGIEFLRDFVEPGPVARAHYTFHAEAPLANRRRIAARALRSAIARRR